MKQTQNSTTINNNYESEHTPNPAIGMIGYCAHRVAEINRRFQKYQQGRCIYSQKVQNYFIDSIGNLNTIIKFMDKFKNSKESIESQDFNTKITASDVINYATNLKNEISKRAFGVNNFVINNEEEQA